MKEVIPRTRRRGFIRGALVALGGALGFRATGSPGSGAAPVLEVGRTCRLYAWLGSREASHADPSRGSECRHRRGELSIEAGGPTVGEYYAAHFCPPAAFGANPRGTPAVELQTLRLPEGILFGAGANEASDEGIAEHAVLGGTGRYAGARGTMKLTPLPRSEGRAGWVAVEINLFV